MKSNFYTIAYAAVLGLICATALTAVNELTREAYDNNKKAKKAREIMKVLDVTFDANTPAKEIVEIQKREVKEDPDKAKLYGVDNVYVSGEGKEKLWAIEFGGDGMWKPRVREADLRGRLRVAKPLGPAVGPGRRARRLDTHRAGGTDRPPAAPGRHGRRRRERPSGVEQPQ